MMVSEVVINDFRQHCRPKLSEKKSVATRIIHQVLINDLSSREQSIILNAPDEIAQVNQYTSNQLIELASVLNTSRAIMLDIDFTIAEQIIEQTLIECNDSLVNVLGYNITKLYFQELSIQCTSNYRSVYESSVSGVPLSLLKFLVTATPIEVDTLALALSEKAFINIQCFPDLINQCIHECNDIFSQDDTFFIAIKYGATKPFFDHFFPEHCYSDARSISIIRKLTGVVAQKPLRATDLNKQIIATIKNEKIEIESEYNKKLKTFEECKFRLFKFLISLSNGENTSLKLLWSQYIRSSTLDHLSKNHGETS